MAVLDTDLQSPGIHVLFGFDQEHIRLTLVDFLWGKCEIEDTVYDVSSRVCPGTDGQCWLVPASLTTQAISRILDEGYEVSRLNSHFDELMESLDLDCLLIDTHPGLNRETMLTSAISDTLVLLIRATVGRDVHTVAGGRDVFGMAVAGALVLVLLVFSVGAVQALPQFGEPAIARVADAPAAYYLDYGLSETGSGNIVTAILLDFRIIPEKPCPPTPQGYTTTTQETCEVVTWRTDRVSSGPGWAV